jgi:hypothetical protein
MPPSAFVETQQDRNGITLGNDRSVGNRRVGPCARHGAWQLANWMFAVGIWCTLAGLAALTVLLSRHSRDPVLPGQVDGEPAVR